MIRVKNKKTHVFMLVLLLILGIGFAALAATLKINGTITIDSAKWDVHFENVEVAQGSVTATTVPTSDDATTTEMTYAVNFTKPGDFYEFTVDMANDGTIDAMVNLVTNKVYSSDGETEKQLPAYLKSTVTYVDGVSILPNQLLAKQTSEKIKVRVEFRTDVDASELPSTNETTVFKFSSTFKQADETSCQRPTTFANDSWETIACNVKQNPASYAVGEEKELVIDNYTYHIRVINNTTPNECKNEDFSQTACGFVVEFKELLSSTYYMSGIQTSIGGWPESDMRKYLNDKSSGFYNKLVEKIGDIIIDTKVVSGHANEDNNSNHVSTDKLYIVSTKEVGLNVEYDSLKNETRILDFYLNKPNSFREKKLITGNLSTYWWTRSPKSTTEYHYYYISYDGSYWEETASYSAGVSPTFRIG